MHVPRGLSRTRANTHVYIHTRIWTYIHGYTHVSRRVHTHHKPPPPQAQQRGLVPGRSRGPPRRSPRPAAPRRGPGKPAGGRSGRGVAAGTPQPRVQPLPRPLTRAGSAATGTVRPPQRPGQRHFRSRREAPGSARSPLGVTPRDERGCGWRVSGSRPAPSRSRLSRHRRRRSYVPRSGILTRPRPPYILPHAGRRARCRRNSLPRQEVAAQP